MPNLYYKAFELIQLSRQADDIMSKAVAEVIKPMEQVGLMFSDNHGVQCVSQKVNTYHCHNEFVVK